MSLTYLGSPIGLAEVDVTAHTTARAVVAFSSVVNEDRTDWYGVPLGFLTWDRDSKGVELVFVNDDMRRRGLATSLMKFARTLDPSVTHGEDRSPAGTAWAESFGEDVPPLGARITAEDAHSMGAAMMVALHGFTARDVLSPMVAAQ